MCYPVAQRRHCLGSEPGHTWTLGVLLTPALSLDSPTGAQSYPVIRLKGSLGLIPAFS